MTQLVSAIRTGSPGPAVLSKYRMEAEFWKRLGLRREDLANRPSREVEDYTLIMQLEIREESAKTAQTGGMSGR